MLRVKLFQQQNGVEILVFQIISSSVRFFFPSLSSMAHNKVGGKYPTNQKTQHRMISDTGQPFCMTTSKTRELIHASSQHYTPSKTTQQQVRLESHDIGKPRPSSVHDAQFMLRVRVSIVIVKSFSHFLPPKKQNKINKNKQTPSLNKHLLY